MCFLTSMWVCTKFLPALRCRLENWSLALTSLLRVGFSFNRRQSREFTGLLTWHNTTLRRNFYIMGLTVLCVWNVGQRKKPQHTLCVKLWSHLNKITCKLISLYHNSQYLIYLWTFILPTCIHSVCIQTNQSRSRWCQWLISSYKWLWELKNINI